MDADVGVIGIGTMGSMAVWQLARNEISVIGFEQFGIGHSRSSGGGETRLFRTAYKEGPEYVPLLHESLYQWRQLEKESGRELLTLNGGLTIGDPESDFIKISLKSTQQYSLDHEILDNQQAKDRYPQHYLLPNEIMVIDKMAGFIRPEYAMVSAVQCAESHGAVIYRHTRVEKIQPHDSGVLIYTNGKEYNVRHLIVASGPWMGTLIPELKKQLTVQRLIQTWFPPDDNELFTADTFPVFIREYEQDNLYGAPTIDGTMVKVSLGMKHGKVKDPSSIDRNVKPEELVTISKVVEKFFPDLFSDPVRVSVCMDTYTKDKHPIVGRLPSLQNTIVLGGFSGHGFKLASVIGRIAADLVLNGDTELPIYHMSPNRF